MLRPFSAETADRLGLSAHVPDKQVPPNTEWVQHELKELNKAATMFNNAAAYRAQSQYMFVVQYPYLIAGLYHQHESS